ncbi:MAG TPA: penicillin-binding transpeptidase domain-containing protein [Opitutaceae bacterium]|nr:penicillin-binding transpeptidase domain-containing protein [Opitutaceae bacterium]
MPTTDVNLADRPGTLVESHKGYDPRIVFFYFIIAALLAILVGGLAWEQLHLIASHSERERQQNQRRILFPGPRGNIYDRDGTLLVGNAPHWTAVLHIDELRAELRREYSRIEKNYKATTGDKKEMPSERDLAQIARVSVAQHYLDLVNVITGRDLKIDAGALQDHFSHALLLPFTLAEGLSDADYARLVEHLPVNSPVEVYPAVSRYYPFGSAATHTLGYVRADIDVDSENFPGADLRGQFKMKGTRGKDGLEKWFDAELQGEPGGRIYLVDPAGFRVKKPLEERAPKQGRNLVTSLDIDLQLAAEAAVGDQNGAVVALDVATGEVLALASKPDYDLNAWYPRMPVAAYKAIQERNAEFNRALNGTYSPGSTFKILVSIAGLRSNRINPADTSIDCEGTVRIGNRNFGCDNGLAHHGALTLSEAIAQSCDIYFYERGIDVSPDIIAAEAHRFHLDEPTGIELPGETHRMLIPTRAWKKEKYGQSWTDGDTANMAIGQGFVDVTPLQMACFAASVARGETWTKPTLLHDPKRTPQHTEPIGLTSEQQAIILAGMKGVVTRGTAAKFFASPGNAIPGVQIAGKTGTAQRAVYQDGKFVGNINFAWFICFAPADKPEIAVAAMVEGDTPGENYAGGIYGAGVANAVLKKYFEKKAHPAQVFVSPLKKS